MDALSEAYIKRYSNSGIEVIVKDKVTSTNTLLKEYAALNPGDKTDKVMIASEQTMGKGRRGRAFYSPDSSGVYLSFLLHPHVDISDAMNLTTLAAVAVSEAVDEVSGLKTGIKWVNDIYLNGKKICGILTECPSSVNGKVDYVVVGIGINVCRPKEGFPESIANIAGALFDDEDEPADDLKNRLCVGIIDKFDHYYKDLPEKSYIDEYRNRSFLIGKDVYIVRPDDYERTEEAEAVRVLGIDDECRLHVRYKDGSEKYLFSGEVSVKNSR